MMPGESSPEPTISKSINVPKIGLGASKLNNSTSTLNMSSLPHEYAQRGTFKILIGCEKTEFVVHKSLFASHSPFLNACLNNPFKEGHTNEINLPEDDPNVFGFLLDWVYSDGKPDDLFGERGGMDVYIHTYVLADKFMMNRCKNYIMDQMRMNYSDQYGDEAAVSAVWILGLALNSHLSHFLIEQYAWDMIQEPELYTDERNLATRAAIREPMAALQPEVMAEVLDEMLGAMTAKKKRENTHAIVEPIARKGCCFHDHSNGDFGACGVPGTAKKHGAAEKEKGKKKKKDDGN